MEKKHEKRYDNYNVNVVLVDCFYRECMCLCSAVCVQNAGEGAGMAS